MQPNNRARLRRHPLLMGILVGLSMSAYAQDQQTQEPTDTDTVEIAQSEEAPIELEKMVVTGSRIRRAGFDTLEPATVLDRTYIENRGHTNVADALNELPSFIGSLTPEGGQGESLVGVNFVNRFGLGDNRTLTLINGRRFVSSNVPALFGAEPGLQVDLNVVPTALVDRVENLSIGGAPTYGSDAIAGVVNVILRQDFEGVAGGMGYGVTERGDNQRFNAYSTVGVGFNEGRGNVTFSLNHDKSDGVLSRDREWLAAAYNQRWNPADTGPNDGIPSLVMIRDHRIWPITWGGVVRPGLLGLPGADLRFNESGELVPHNPGDRYSMLDAVGGDGIRLTDMQQVMSDLERTSVSVTSRFGVNDSTDFFFEGLYYSGEARELADQATYNASLFGGRSGTIYLPADYALLTPQARSVLAASGLPLFPLERASRDLADQSSSSTSQVSRAVIGLEGDFERAGRIFYWEASANFGRATTEVFATHIDHQNFINALHVVRDANGQVVCSATPVPNVYVPDEGVWGVPVADPNCVPLDLLGEGRASQAARDYVTYRTRAVGLSEQEVYNANISSTLFDMWSGELQYAVGVEHRRESGMFDPDEFRKAGLGRNVAMAPTSGKYDTNEAFAEFVMPLVNPASEIPMLRKLDLTGKYRYVDNSINGSFNTYTYGLQWKPLETLEIRSNFTRSLRAPSLMELFMPESSEYQFLTGDPCDVVNIDNGPAARQANCQAFLDYYGLDQFVSSGGAFSRQGVALGNDNLRNETADSYTYGLSWAPAALPGFSVSADYYNIEITDVITRLDASGAAQACFDNPEFNAADVPNANEFCSLVVRDAQGQFTTFTSTYINGTGRNLEAYSVDARYGLKTDRFGNFDFGLEAYLMERLSQELVGGNEIEYVGLVGNPKQSYKARVNWQGKSFGANLTADYIGEGKFNLDATEEDMLPLGVDDQWMFHAGGSYRFSDSTTLRLTVSNLFDEEPPYPTSGYGTYDTLGRRYYVSFEMKF